MNSVACKLKIHSAQVPFLQGENSKEDMVGKMSFDERAFGFVEETEKRALHSCFSSEVIFPRLDVE